MKKLLLSIMAASAMTAHADEGMWTLYNLPNAVYETMKQQGYQLPYDKLYNADDAIMKTVVNFSGYCSGVVVSPDGLVFTNHHCGFESIRSHSTVEHDYMLDGFVAKTQADELPNENMFVSFMVEQKDVTEKILAMGIETMPKLRRAELLDSVENAWSKDVREKDSTLRLELMPFYEGNRFFATTYRDFRDVRLVFAVPKSMGKFGGETDNWMWPRQTCDFSVFRIYCDPETGGPAEYSEENVPYHPEHWAQVSTEGYRDGSFSMTMGYPGSTSRYLSSYGIYERYTENAIRAQVRGVKQEVMKRHMDASEAVRIKYDSKFASSANYWKNSIGMNKCIDSIDLIGQKRKFEQLVQQWKDSTGLYPDGLDFKVLGQLYADRQKVNDAYMYFAETFMRTDELSRRAQYVLNGAVPVGHGRRQHINIKDNSDTWDYDTDREVLGTLLDNYRKKMKGNTEYMPEFFNTIDQDFGGDCQRYADYLYSTSRLMKKGKRLYPNKKSFLKDPGVKFGLELTDLYAKITDGYAPMRDGINAQERHLCAAKLRMEEDMPHYSDANFTMRLSYGQVKEYRLGNWRSGFQTKAPSLVEKMKKGDTMEDYRVQPEMLTLMEQADGLPLCFLTTNDITGGNSGSPMFDGQNRLIGLAFDGNWDSLASDIFFDSELARCIGLDVRFLIYMMDKWGHADRLLKEIGVR
ncbi:MAG: S46 family peptidase [Prevotella sp.]|nr:S46 family peptidase [Prevotella sp.]